MRVGVRSTWAPWAVGLRSQVLLLSMSVSLSFSMEADRSTVPKDPLVATSVVTVITGNEPPAGTGPGCEHSRTERMQDQPEPVALGVPVTSPLVAHLATTTSLDAAVPALRTARVMEASPPG